MKNANDIVRISKDRLSRYDEVQGITNLIRSCILLKEPITFSLEADWGKGKSWVLHKIELTLKGFDITQEDDEKKINSIPSKYLIIKYNAWERDYYEEPLISMLVSIINQLNEKLTIENFIKKSTKNVLKEVLKTLKESLGVISQRVLGINVVEIGEKVYSEYKKVNAQKNVKLISSDKFANIEDDLEYVVLQLEKISEEIPIVFIIDELDRCIPIVAIKTLERLHHIFSKISNSVTVVSICRTQIDKSIKQLFGEADDDLIEEYLRKFFNFKVVLEAGKADPDILADSLEEISEFFEGGNYNTRILSLICQNLPQRDYENIVKNAMLCHRFSKLNSKPLPYQCFEAELLLFADKAIQISEKNINNTSPNNTNTPVTNMGKEIKKLLQDIKKSCEITLPSQSVPQIQIIFNINNKNAIILYIMDIVKNYGIQWKIQPGSEVIAEKLDKVYREYKKYYKFIR